MNDAKQKGYKRTASLGFVWPAPASAEASSRYGLPSLSKDDPLYISQDYWRGRVWTPMLQIVYWGLAEYTSEEAKGAADGLVEQSKALMLREWFGYESNNDYAGTGRRVYENYGADTAQGYTYSSSAAPFYAWGALSGFIGLVHNGFYNALQDVASVWTSNTICTLPASAWHVNP
jgi:glycogen debranching enzyme